MANLSYTAAQIDERLAKTDDIGDLADLQTTDKDSLVDAVNELFTSVGSGKSAIAAAITDKGVPTAATDTFADMAQNIEDIPTGSTPVLQTKSVTVKVGDSTDDDCVTSVTGTYSGGGGGKNVQAYIGYASRTANSYGATSVTLTVAKTGTYKVSWCAARGSSSGTMGTNLHIGSTAGTNQQTWTGTYWQNIVLEHQSLTQDTVLTLYATSGSTSRTVYVGNLIIEEE